MIGTTPALPHCNGALGGLPPFAARQVAAEGAATPWERSDVFRSPPEQLSHVTFQRASSPAVLPCPPARASFAVPFLPLHPIHFPRVPSASKLLPAPPARRRTRNPTWSPVHSFLDGQAAAAFELRAIAVGSDKPLWRAVLRPARARQAGGRWVGGGSRCVHRDVRPGTLKG